MSLRGAALAAILAMAVSGCSTAATTAGVAPSSAQPTPSATTTQTPAPTLAPSGVVTKVLVFIEENHSLSQMRSGMPYTFGLARQFGYATSYAAIQHPSLPNYIAIAGGQTFGITNDHKPSDNPVSGTSVFGQAIASGKTAAAFVDGMPQSCATMDGGTGYAVRHNPWAYFTNERDICQRYDVAVERLPEAIGQGRLPNVGMVIPNVCNDAHDCPLGTADTWFEGWMTKIFEGPDWRSGHLAVVLTGDEDDKSSDNKVLTVVIHPSQRANVVTSPLTHYSLTRLFEEVTGTPFLFGAASAPSMAKAFGLPLK
jgi:phosphatidylinositol-3-phosphatase